MQYQIQVKPVQPKNGQKYKVIQITDIALHTATRRATPSIPKKIQKSFKRNKPGRIYGPIDNATVSQEGSFTLELLKMDPDFVRMVQEEEAKGYKVLVQLPKGGIPIVLGDDAVEFMNSKNGKRLTRGLAQEKDKD